MTKIKNKTTGEWEDVANLAQSDVIRNPDWSRAIAITSLPYTAPEDGMIVGFNGYGTPTDLSINNVTVSRGIDGSDYNQIQCPVAKGDILSGTYGTASLKFVPYKTDVVDNRFPTNYSTQEQFTGKYWIDGKKIYRKVFTGLNVNVSNHAWANLFHNDDNIDIIIDHKCWNTDNRDYDVNATSQFSFRVYNGYIQHYLVASISPSGFKCVCLEYTKTTD